MPNRRLEPTIPPQAVSLQRVERLIDRLERNLSTVSQSIEGLSDEMRALRHCTDSMAQEMEGVEQKLERIAEVTEAVVGGGPYERCQECGCGIVYEQAIAGWTTSCFACHWSDFVEDPFHRNPPPNLA